MGMLVFVLALWTVQAAPAPVQWGQWRGPFNTGMAATDAPLRWTGRDVRWKLEIPGRGHSPRWSPAMSLSDHGDSHREGRRAHRSGRAGGGAAAGLEHRFEVLAIDRTSGTIAWQRTATTATPHEGYHRSTAASPRTRRFTDGSRSLAFFRLPRASTPIALTVR